MKKKILGTIVTVTLSAIMLTACSGGSTTNSSYSNDNITSSSTNSSSSYSDSSNSSSKSYSNSSSSSFTNKYGTSTTKCAQSGCNNYIASSGDTNCCITHSNKCIECKKYIDGDAMYCMSCLSSAAKKSSSSSSGSSYGSSSKSYSSSSSSGSGTCKFKEGGQYVCSSKATNGSYCSYHKKYLDDAYNSLFGD